MTQDKQLSAALSDAQNMIHGYVARIAELEEDLKFIERWTVHHGSYPSVSAKEALSAIQYYPSIQAITDSYADGKRPDTFNPYARIAELEAELTALKVDAKRYRHLRAKYWNDAPFCVVVNPKEAVKLGYDCPSLERLDSLIDGDMYSPLG